MRFQAGIWSALDALPTGAAVLEEWRREFGYEFDAARSFLVPTQEQSRSYPCTHRPACECRHRVVMHSPTRIVAVCECGCEPIVLQPKDVVVFEVSIVKLGEAVRRALGFGSPTGGTDGVRGFRIATQGPAKVPVHFYAPDDEGALVAELERMIASMGGPFVLLTPTEAVHSATVSAMQTRHGFLVLGLVRWLAVTGPGEFKLREPIDGVLAAFEQRLAAGPGLVKTVEEIHRGITTVAKQKRDLSEAKARLEQMHGEGMFSFSRHIDREAREQFLAVMAGGDVAKAARDLDMKDSTLRSRLAKWPRRGKAYAALAEIVRWRKSIKGQAGMEQAKRVASGAERDVDFPAVIRDVIAELEELDPDNWEERCGNLADALRKMVS